MNALNNLLPHGFCIKWTPELLWTYVAADGLIALSYYSIPFALAYFVWKRKDLHYRWMFMLFVAFILACGTTHLMDIVVLWHPFYWADATIKAVTAVISFITAIAMVLLLPRTIKLPSPEQYAREVQEKLHAYEELKAAQSSLVDMTRLKEAEEAKNQIALSLQATLEAIPDMLFEVDIDGRYYSVHSPKSELIPIPVHELDGKMIDDILPQAAAETVKRALREADEKGHSKGAQIEVNVPLGRRWFELSIAKKSPMDATCKRFVVLSRDITERKEAENELKIAATAFDTQEGIIVTDVETRILRVNQSFEQITGYSAGESIGKTPNFLSSGKHDKKFYEELWRSISSHGSWEGEIWNKRKNGEIYPERLVITAVKDKHEKVTNYVATISDITQSKAASDEIRSLAFYDPLTKLPNRRLLLDRLKQALSTSSISGQLGALLYLDIDHFKALNDTLGHSTGDLLLKIMSSRITNCVRENDIVARIGGDEFVILMEGLGTNEIEAATFAEGVAIKLQDLLSQTYKLDSYEHVGSVSIGATLFYDHQDTVEEVLKQADIAVYQAKDAGRNTIRFFDIKMQQAVEARVHLERELRNAIEKKQFELYYQIQVDKNKTVLGAEALIRWIHPERGVVTPAEFIPLAENTGLIIPIGQWVLETACAQLEKWRERKETRELSISVNVSAKQFNQANFVQQLIETISSYSIDPAFLKLELTESMLLDNVEMMIDKIVNLRKIGVRFELDDFGTGYSSLNYLKQLPLNQLKIDQSFVRDISNDDNDQALVRAIIAMGHSLGLKIIAEGVESDDQVRFLMEHGCDHFQGYLFGKPQPVAMLEKTLAGKSADQ